MTSCNKADMKLLRKNFTRACEQGDYFQARAISHQILYEDNKGSVLRFLSKTIASHQGQIKSLNIKKIAALSSYSFEFVKDALIVKCFQVGVFPYIYQPGFNQFRQEILNPASQMYAFEPDIILLSVLGEDFCPDLYKMPSGANMESDAHIDSVVSDLLGLLEVVRQNCSAAVIMQNFAPPEFPFFGVGDVNLSTGQRYRFHSLNRSLLQATDAFKGLYLVDYEGLIYRYGTRNWYDKRMEYYAQAPIEKNMYLNLAHEFSKVIRILYGGAKKCLVMDLDNTLWGGILGEDGSEGIKLGAAYPGNAFKKFQEELLELHNRGILLAIASKNNMADVEHAFKNHTDMVLSLDHFVAKQINWQPKSQSILEIASTLNIGLEHMVFIDDNPVECEQVAMALPKVEVIHFPKAAELFNNSLFEEGYFDALSQSQEDKKRTDFYLQRTKAESLRTATTNIEDFYRSLQMEIQFDLISEKNIKRLAQLTQKTNQYNATTYRYNLSEMKNFQQDDACNVYAASLRDKFGDNGIIALMITRQNGTDWFIDTFLLSCRVIGRTVEEAMLAFLCKKATAIGIKKLRGEIIPTLKNIPIRGLYKKNNFSALNADSCETEWILDLEQKRIAFPEWFRLKDET